jgi:hypothetical protein
LDGRVTQIGCGVHHEFWKARAREDARLSDRCGAGCSVSVGDNRSPLLDVRVAGSMLVAMRIILIPLALVAAAVIAMVLLAARGRPPTPVGPALAMNASFP